MSPHILHPLVGVETSKCPMCQYCATNTLFIQHIQKSKWVTVDVSDIFAIYSSVPSDKKQNISPWAVQTTGSLKNQLSTTKAIPTSLCYLFKLQFAG